MTEAAKSQYFRKSETCSPSTETDLKATKGTEEKIDVAEKEATSSFDTLLKQEVINVNDYRKIRATRRVIGHVHFEPD